jgi:hypothetical protein
MVLKRIQQPKQNGAAHSNHSLPTEKNSAVESCRPLTTKLFAGKSTSSAGQFTGKSTARCAKEAGRPAIVGMRDVDINDVKLNEPKWRSKKFNKITLIKKDDAAVSNEVENHENKPQARKVTLQDFIVAGIRGKLTSAKLRKQLGMATSTYVVVPMPKVLTGYRETQPIIEETEPIETVQTVPIETVQTVPIETAQTVKNEMGYTEMMDDDFVVINVD